MPEHDRSAPSLAPIYDESEEYSLFATLDEESARVALVECPTDRTSSGFRGSRHALDGLFAVDTLLESYSPYSNKDLADPACLTIDRGLRDVLDELETDGQLQRIFDACVRHHHAGRRVLALGGEHTISNAAFTAAREVHGDVALVIFDKHPDFKDEYLGDRWNHTTWLKRCWDTFAPFDLWIFGLLSGDAAEVSEVRDAARGVSMTLDGYDAFLEELGDRPVYVSLDFDAIELSQFPATGCPEPGGIPFAELIRALAALHGRNVIGADAVEFCPERDVSNISAAAACVALRELALILRDSPMETP